MIYYTQWTKFNSYLKLANKNLYNDKEKDMIDVNNLLTQAISETTKLNVGEKFLVKDLFKGYEWNRIPRNTRLLLGTLFLNAVNNNANLKIQTIEKSSSNQQKYQKR